METTMDVDVLELWTNTVARMPIIKPQMGLFNRVLSANTSPASLPDELKKTDMKESRY